MAYLLDTHVILWYAQGSDELSASTRDLLEDQECFYSTASLWEIAIKQKRGSLEAVVTIPELADFCTASGFLPLAITPEHLEATKRLDFIHRDPFDRLLIAQALSEDLTIITRDQFIPHYPIATIVP